MTLKRPQAGEENRESVYLWLKLSVKQIPVNFMKLLKTNYIYIMVFEVLI